MSRLPRLPLRVALVEKAGVATVRFQQWWQSFAEQIEEQDATQDTLIADLETAVADIAAAQADIIAAQAAADAAQADVTAVEGDLANYVLKNQTAAWGAPTGTLSRAVYASYAGQTVSNPPTQAEMQALDDAVKAMSQAVVGLITDLKVQVLT